MFAPPIGRQFIAARLPLARSFSSSASRNADYTHAVIGAGAVGLAIARQLAAREGTSTLLVERHGSVGTETSSRNSEVIHAGLYYGLDSLKTKLCVKGREMMYDLCRKDSIPHKNCKKWLVAQDSTQLVAITKVHDFAQSIGVPTRFVSHEEAKAREPDVRAEAGVVESLSTGIVDSHALMAYLEGSFQDRGGDCAFHTAVTGIEPLDSGRDGYRITTTSSPGAQGPEDTVTVSTLINSAGLFACHINNMLLPPSRHLTPFFAKGSYFSYSAAHPKPTHLIYPAPVEGHGGLGTHLTLDMAGRVRFGPDVEWVDDPNDLKPNPARLAEAIEMIKTYLPTVQEEAIDLDYCGIRPKLGRLSATSSGNFQDFIIRREDEAGLEGFVNLLGIESPGLTSCLAIGQMVEDLLYR